MMVIEQLTITEITEKLLASLREEIDYLNSLPLTYKKYNILLVHGSPLKPQEWLYIFDEWDAKAAFEATEEWIIFVGHSHVPGCFSCKENEIKIILELSRGVNI